MRAYAELLLEASAEIPTRRGRFRMTSLRHPSEPEKQHVVLHAGDVSGGDVLVRVHSECMTSEIFGSLKCDCAEQLDLALARITEAGRGVLVYLRQEGRDIGLASKLRAYALQARGLDTVDANRALGLPDDARRYESAATILRHFGVEGVRLMTNNPAKVAALLALGVTVRERMPLLVAPTAQSEPYLRAKRERMRHDL